MNEIFMESIGSISVDLTPLFMGLIIVPILNLFKLNITILENKGEMEGELCVVSRNGIFILN
jgi:hypothetical protein